MDMLMMTVGMDTLHPYREKANVYGKAFPTTIIRA